jgi:hypothetical protein
MGKFTRPEPKWKLSEESAMVQIGQFLDGYGIDPDGGDLASLKNSLLEKLLRFVRLGYVEIGDDLTIVQTLVEPPGSVPTITYKKLKGKAIIDSDGTAKDEKYNVALHALLGSLSGEGPAVFQTLGPIDLQVAETLGTLFKVR